MEPVCVSGSPDAAACKAARSTSEEVYDDPMPKCPVHGREARTPNERWWRRMRRRTGA